MFYSNRWLSKNAGYQWKRDFTADISKTEPKFGALADISKNETFALLLEALHVVISRATIRFQNQIIIIQYHCYVCLNPTLCSADAIFDNRLVSICTVWLVALINFVSTTTQQRYYLWRLLCCELQIYPKNTTPLTHEHYSLPLSPTELLLSEALHPQRNHNTHRLFRYHSSATDIQEKKSYWSKFALLMLFLIRCITQITIFSKCTPL